MTDERSYLIFHFPGIVLDDESVFLPLRLFIERIFFVNVVELVKKILVAATREAINKIRLQNNPRSL